jgi:hypothetical protein
METIMINRIFVSGVMGLAVAALAIASACAAMGTPNNPTTQAWGSVSAVTGEVAPVVATAAPPPWGQIVAGILGAVSVIAGIVAHSATSNASGQQLVNAVTTGLQAASQSVGSTPSKPPKSAGGK